MQDMDWLPTRYRSRHPSWAGSDLVILPHMGYLVCNDKTWSRLSLVDFDPDSLHKAYSLNARINKGVIDKNHEIFMRCTPIAWTQSHLIGLRNIHCEIDSVCELGTGDYSVHEDRILSGTYGFRGLIVDCTALLQSKTRIIQKLFRHRRWCHSIPIYSQNIRKIKAFQEAVSCLPDDVMETIIELFVKSLDDRSDVINRNKHPSMLVIETELFKQRVFDDGQPVRM